MNKMKCPKCKKIDLLAFQAGRDGTFVPIFTQYICIKCGLCIENRNWREEELTITFLDIKDER